MPTENKPERLIAIGRIGAPKGLSGALKVHSYSGEFDHFLSLKSVELSAPEKPDAPTLKVKIAGIEAGTGLSITFEGYSSPEKAGTLTGRDICVPISMSAPLRKNEWYIRDLVGLKIVHGESAVAIVRGVFDGAADPCLECELRDNRTVLIPFRKEFVGEVDTVKGTIELLAPWLLE